MLKATAAYTVSLNVHVDLQSSPVAASKCVT